MIGDLAKLHHNCLAFLTTSLGILLLSFCFGGSCFAKDHQTVFGGMVVNWFRVAYFELQGVLFLECWSVFALVVSSTTLDLLLFLLFVHYVWSECKALTYFT